MIDGWIAGGRMAAVDSTPLFFTRWAATPTAADSWLQVGAVLGREAVAAADHERAPAHGVALRLRGCGLTPPPSAQVPDQ